MLSASLLGSVIINRIVHHDHQELFANWKRRQQGPMHVRLVALALAACHAELARALAEPERQGDAWHRAIAVLEGSGRDPNWRSRPSVFDTRLGFTAPPGRPPAKESCNCSELKDEIVLFDHMCVASIGSCSVPYVGGLVFPPWTARCVRPGL